MFDYRYEATRDGDGWLITFPDFTGVNTDAENEDEVPQRAHDALLTMLEHYMRTRTELPAPTFDRSTSVVALGEIVDLKLMLYQGMVWNAVTQAELAKRLRASPTLVSRLLDLDHISKAEQIRAAMDAIGVRPIDQVRSELVDAAAGATGRGRLHLLRVESRASQEPAASVEDTPQRRLMRSAPRRSRLRLGRLHQRRTVDDPHERLDVNHVFDSSAWPRQISESRPCNALVAAPMGASTS